MTARLNAAMKLALAAAQESPDPSTQNGAVLISALGEIQPHTASCNEFPRGVAYSDERWERPLKYSVIEHAERNVIYSAARSGTETDDATLVAVWAACSDCARAIIQSGITELVTFPPADNGRWSESIDIAMVMLQESGVKVVYLDGNDFAGSEPLRRDGRPWHPC